MRIHHILIISVIFFSQISMAAYVEKVKGKKTLIVLEGMSVSKGDVVDVIDPTTKKKSAILRITAVKDEKAIGQLLRGKAKINQQVVAKTKSSSSSGEMPTSRKSKSTSSSSSSTFAVGGLLGAGFDNMQIVITNVEVEKTGMGMSFLGAADLKLRDWLSFRALAGVEQFNAKGDAATAVCTGSTSCEAEIMYFTLMGWGRFHLTQAIWAGFGLGLQHPLSKSTNSLEPSTIKTSAVYAFGGGFDIPLGTDMYLPLQAEYGMQPKSDQVSVSYVGVRAGLMIRF